MNDEFCHHSVVAAATGIVEFAVPCVRQANFEVQRRRESAATLQYVGTVPLAEMTAVVSVAPPIVFPDSIAQAVCALTTEEFAPLCVAACRDAVLPAPPHAAISSETLMTASAAARVTRG